MIPKEKLYYLLSEFKKGNYDTNTFCDLFTVTYNVETDYELLNAKEHELFRELAKVTARFSQFEEDLKLPNVFYDEHQVKQKVSDVIRELSIE